MGTFGGGPGSWGISPGGAPPSTPIAITDPPGLSLVLDRARPIQNPPPLDATAAGPTVYLGRARAQKVKSNGKLSACPAWLQRLLSATSSAFDGGQTSRIRWNARRVEDAWEAWVYPARARKDGFLNVNLSRILSAFDPPFHVDWYRPAQSTPEVVVEGRVKRREILLHIHQADPGEDSSEKLHQTSGCGPMMRGSLPISPTPRPSGTAGGGKSPRADSRPRSQE